MANLFAVPNSETGGGRNLLAVSRSQLRGLPSNCSRYLTVAQVSRVTGNAIWYDLASTMSGVRAHLHRSHIDCVRKLAALSIYLPSPRIGIEFALLKIVIARFRRRAMQTLQVSGLPVRDVMQTYAGRLADARCRTTQASLKRGAKRSRR